MVKLMPIFLLLMMANALQACDTISRLGFQFDDDLPVLCDPTGFPSQRHQQRPLGSTAADQGFYEYLPPGYDQGNQDYPLLLFIHGLGENGDGDSQLGDLLSTGIPRLIADDDWSEDLPFVVLSPQNSLGGCTRASSIFDFIQFAKTTYRINPQRVYLTGLSCGAIGSWNYLAAHTNNQIAAVVPIAGNGNSAFNNAGCELNRVPIWAFHGDADSTVGVGGTTGPINNLLNCTDPAPIDTSMIIYPGVGHNSWQRTYDLSAGHDIYHWFLGHKNLAIADPEPLASGRSVEVDFGVQAGATTAPWNNIHNIAGSATQLLDDQATVTTVHVVITDDFNGTNQNGIGTNGVGVPETVTADNFWVGSFDGHAAALLETATVEISGLDPLATYQLELYASRSGDDGGNGRLTRYTIGAVFQDLEVSDNTTGSVLFAGLTGSEVIELSINVSESGSGRFAYLSGMTLTRTD
jgi:poly(3-hydroxybutyrate) depolymerase